MRDENGEERVERSAKNILKNIIQDEKGERGGEVAKNLKSNPR